MCFQGPVIVVVCSGKAGVFEGGIFRLDVFDKGVQEGLRSLDL